MREFIHFSDNDVQLVVHVYLFREDDCIVSYCPSLDLSGCGSDEEEARRSFEIVIKEYLDYCLKNQTLKEDLSSQGWMFEGNKIKEPPFITLYTRNNSLKDVVDSKDYTRYSVNQEIQAFA